MSAIIALIKVGLLLLTTLLTDGSARYFTIDKKKGQAPLEVTFSVEDLQASGLGKKFIWTFGDGQTLITTNTSITHTYGAAGVYTAKLQYLSKTTDALSKVKNGGTVKIEVVAPANVLPIASLNCFSSVINQLVCDASGSLDSDGSIVSYQYDWGDGANNLVTNVSAISHSYTSGGEKNVRLTVTDNRGGITVIEKTFILKSNTAPVANFSCSNTGIQKIHCESTSTDNEDNISSVAWTLDDGTAYSSTSFDHTFNRPQDVAIASHGVSLKVTDALGLESILAKDVEVDLEAVREAPRGYFKAYIDGTTVDLRAFIVKTQFNIKRATYQIYNSQNTLIHTLPISDFYQNHSTKINLENFGNYRVTLTIVDYRDQQITITRQMPLVEDTSTLAPFVAFRATQSNIRTLYLNLNQSFDYDENYSIREFVVNLGNGQARTLTTDTFLTYTYPEAGTYTLTVTAKTNHGTERVISQPITITDSEVAPVMPDPTFAYRIYSFAQNVSFYNEKSGTPNGEIISYHWDFGDNTTATGETQAHFYLPGEYLVKLTVVDTAGYSSTQTQKITILAEGDDIVANIDCTQRQPYLDITQMCKVNALDKFHEINRIRVVWGDGTVFTLATTFDPREGVYYPQKAYTAEGTYAVRLIVNTARGAFKTHDISHTVTARRPVANIQCAVNNLLVFCNGLGSYDPKGTSLKYTFDFGNGHVETNMIGSISYAYSEAGFYPVKLTVEDTQGFQSTAFTNIQVVTPPNQLPVVLFDCDSPSPRTLYCWDNGSYDSDGNITIRKIDFGDGQFAFINPPDSVHHIFSTSGSHTVTFTVIDEDGGVTTESMLVNIKENNNPVASFECSTPGPQRLNCYSTSTDPDHEDYPVKFNWSFGDGLSQEGLTGWFDHTYPTSGEVSVKLVVEDQFGGMSEVVKNYTTTENLRPVANPNCFIINGRSYQCNSNAYDPDGQALSYQWKIGNETFSGESILYTFTDGGQKVVHLSVKDFFGAEVATSVTINIEGPAIGLLCSVTGPLKIRCDSSETENLNEVKITYYRFEIDQKDIIEDKVVDYEFSSFGTHKVKLMVATEFGEVVYREQEFSFTPQYLPPKANFNYDVDTGFRASFSGAPSQYQEREVKKYIWNFGDGSEIVVTSHENVVHTYVNEGYYNVNLVVEDERGATNSTLKRIYIFNSEVPDPGPSVDDTLLGIDSDNDGVRDDIQRWIALESRENVVLKNTVKKLSKYYQMNFQNLDDSERIREISKKQEYAMICLSSIVDEERVQKIDSVLKLMNFNTERRVKALLPIMDAKNGTLSEGSLDMATPEVYCQKLD